MSRVQGSWVRGGESQGVARAQVCETGVGDGEGAGGSGPGERASWGS